MPRDGSGIYSRPPGTNAVPDTTIESTKYNNNVADIETDLNAPRPIIAGGTGANSAETARAALKAEVSSQVVANYDTHAFTDGSFISSPGATNAPSAGYLAGIAYGIGHSAVALEVRDLNYTPEIKYTRFKVSGTWSAWQSDNAVYDARYVNTTGDLMSGSLNIEYATPQIFLTSTGTNNGDLNFRTGALLRWQLSGNFGTPGDVVFARFNDAGAYLDTPFSIDRSSGNIVAAANLTAGASIAAGNTVTAGGSLVTNGGTISTPTAYNIVSAAGAGGVYLRPNGTNSTVAEFVVHASGLAAANGTMLQGTGVVRAAGTGNPAVTAYNTSIGEWGFWVGTARMDFGIFNNAGAPSGTGMWLSTTNFQVAVATSAKPGGGVWTDSSDARIKNVLGTYDNGLDAILQLQPVRYTFKGNDTDADIAPSNDAVPQYDEDGKVKTTKDAVVTPYANSPHHIVAASGKEFIGLVAQEVEGAMPEMVTQRAGMIDGQPVTDIRDLDTNPLIFALINAIKTLSARIEALEAAAAVPAR